MGYFHITVKAVVIFNNEILLLQRVRPSTDGLGVYELPGGGLNEGESFKEALSREISEETGLGIDLLEPVYTFAHNRKGYYGLGLGFLCQAKSNQVKLSDEHVEYRFVTLEEAEKLLCKEIYADVKDAYEKYIKHYEQTNNQSSNQRTQHFH